MAESEIKPQEQTTQAPAPQQEGVQTPAGNQLGNPRPCPKDCRRCSMQQQICCASMLSFQMYDVMNSVIQRLDTQTQTIGSQSQVIAEQSQRIDAQSQRIEEIESRLRAIQSSEAELSSPMPFEPDLFKV